MESIVEAESIESVYAGLVRGVSTLEGVRSIGISGGLGPLPKVGEGDIDTFVYCTTIPSVDARRAMMEALATQHPGITDVKPGVFSGGHWGVGDLAIMHGVETWVMYFTEGEATAEVDAILRGVHPGVADGGYYPIGRCAMFLGMGILLDGGGFLSSMKGKLASYPKGLAKAIIEHHLDALGDTEDLERAVFRGDTPFFHHALDTAMDHFLQALFALNRTYFPSRKRSLQYVEGFTSKPEGCGQRLLDAIRLGGCPEGLRESFAVWSALVDDLREMAC